MQRALSQNPTPEELIAEFSLLLDVQPQGADRFTGLRKADGRGRIFGGLAIAQALVAARRTVPDELTVHSLHAYFLRGGDASKRIHFRVKRDLDGRSFANRRVVASQDGDAILNLTTSFQRPQPGLEHQQAVMPNVPPPEELVSDLVFAQEIKDQFKADSPCELLLQPRPFDIRSVEKREWLDPQPRQALSHLWLRAVAPLSSSPHVHRAALAYVTDFQLLSTVLQPHGISFHSGGVKAASLDHAIWFHEDFRCDDWLLYVTHSSWTGHSRGFGYGQVFNRSGKLVASVAQEGMIRDVRDQD